MDLATLDRRQLFAAIGAVALAPAAALALPAPPAPTRLAWDRAMSAYLAANRAYDHHYETVCVPLMAELDRIAPEPVFVRRVPRTFDPALEHRTKVAARIGVTAANAENDRLGEFAREREDDVFFTPSPDLPALLWKLENLYGPSARDSEGDGAGWAAKWVDALMDDARRLLAPAGRH